VDPPLDWLERVDAERSNMRAALDWLVAQSRAAPALGLALAVTPLWLARGPMTEGREQLERVMALAGDRFPEQRARVLWCLGLIGELQQNLAASVAAAEQALAGFRALGDTTGAAHALVVLGCAEIDLGHLDRGQACHEEALALSPENRLAVSFLGDLAYHQGDDARAERLLREGISLARDVGDLWTEGFATEMLARVAARQGDRVRAAALLREALPLVWEVGAMANVARCLEVGAYLLAATGLPAPAARLLGAAEALRERRGLPVDRPLLAEHERGVAAVHATLDEERCAAAWQAGRAVPEAAAVAELEDLLGAIIASGEQPNASPVSSHALTARERDTLRLLVDGRSNQEIADALGISLRTAQTHVAHILTKLGVDSRTAAATRAVREGWV
jgi:non-specific serine/threonine protein kinase